MTETLPPSTSAPSTVASLLDLEVVNDPNALRALSAEWTSLLAHSDTNTIFQTPEWTLGWWDAFGANARLLAILARDKRGELVGLAPLMLSRRRMLGRQRSVIEFVGGGRLSDYCDVVIQRTGTTGILHGMLDLLLARADNWDIIHLANIPSHSHTLAGLESFFHDRGYRTTRDVLYECPTRLFRDAVADRKLLRKQSLKRHDNYFRGNGTLEIKHCSSVEDAFAYLDMFFDQHIQRRALTDTPSAFLNERQRDYHRDVVRTLLPKGWLLFSVLLFNQKPIAFHFGFEYANTIMYYKPSFDPNHLRHSPGQVLLKYLLEYALEHDVAELDFGIGDEAYKYRFANHVRHTERVDVYKTGFAYHLDRLLLGAKAQVKRSPLLTRWGRRISRALSHEA